MPSPYEKETIIIGNEEDNAYTIYTYNEKLKRGLQKLAKECPNLCEKSGEAADGGSTWRVLKENLAIMPIKPDGGQAVAAGAAKSRPLREDIEKKPRKQQRKRANIEASPQADE